MVRCQGFTQGTGCSKTTSYTQAYNWQEWQLCYGCARKLHPEYYADKPDHGTGDNKLNARTYEDMITIPTALTNK